MHVDSRKLGEPARLALGVLLSLLLIGFAGTAQAAGQYVQVKYPASTAAGELQVAVTYTLWIPDGVKTIRGVIVHQHGAGTTASKEGSTAAYDLHWQALAKKWDCALLGPSYHVLNEKTDLTPGGSELWFDPRRGSEKTFLKALGELAAKSGHPELQTVPWALWGHSGGGIWADVMSTLHPDRVVGIWFRSGTAAMFRTRSEFPQPEVPAAVYAIPMMVNPGIKEKNPKIPEEKGKERGVWWGNLATFREFRAKGAPIGLAPDPRTGHECGDSRYLAIPFFDACLAMRLPDQGAKEQTLKPVDMSKAWLAPVFGDTAQPAAEFKGNAKEAVWLPNEAVARAWMDYVKTGAVSDTTPPPTPFNVKVTAKADQGTEIVWSADADFESGIRCFLVLRDGKELAQVPKLPVGKFGRPLFQSMTYHDTPSKPLPEMRFLDASAKPSGKHTYAVVSVNSVGLKSEPSSKSGLRSEPSPESAKAAVKGKSPPAAFEGEKTRWHGFDRYDFLMDEQTLAVKPAVKGGKAAKGQRPCIVVVPKAAAPGNPWSWRACYWDHEPQTEVELLKRGFHIVFIAPDGGIEGRDKAWDAWYKHLTENHGLAKRAAFIGMSKGGVNEYSWGVVNPEKVACIYADNPALWEEDFARLPALAKRDVPLLHVCGSEDFLVDRYTRSVEDTYHSLGGSITVIIKDGHAHHRHSLQNPKLIADWIEQHMTPSTANKPAFVDAKFTKRYYYSLEPKYIHLKEENSYATARGPGFTECYDRYDGPTSGKFKTGGFSIVVPKIALSEKS
jgi:pimeloyl-ACP methyl ester carboxylesterase